MSTDASATSQPETPEIDCPLCGEVVRQVSSATLSLALSQHVRWVCARRALSPPPDVERLTREQIRERVQTLPVTDMDGEDMVDLNDVLALFSLSSTPGEPT